MKVSENFYLTEFVPEDVYDSYGEGSLIFVDNRIISGAQLLRDLSGRPVTINNWWDGGKYNESGYRSPNTKTGAFRSQHKAGRAIDVKVEGMTPKEVHALILKHSVSFLKIGITRLESLEFTPSWTHMDCANTGVNKIIIVKP